MRIENTFTVAAPAEAAWDLLMDVPRVIPCMPGATLDEVVDESHWKATMQVKLGPIGLTFATDVERTETDEAAKRVVLKANARDVRNRGRAEATQIVAAPGLLDLDDLGAELAQQRAAERRGHERGEIQHGEAGEGGRHGGQVYRSRRRRSSERVSGDDTSRE